MTEHEPWSWQHERAALAPLVERLTAEDALMIVQRLVQVEVEYHVAPLLAGMVRGSVLRREDERRREEG